MIMIALGVSGCGKRARYLDPPDPGVEKYPKHYPPIDSPGTHL
jgi:hypothetical protein